jgi:pyridoxal phosphate enzyme (YggS family)
MDQIGHSLAALRERIARAADAVHRDPAGITVLAVTKTRTPQEVEAALASGIGLVGENRVQEAEAKKNQVRTPAQWHLIGHLQTNKAARAVELFDLVQSVDSERLARALDRHAGVLGRPLEVLVQVNTSGAETQSGVAPEATRFLVEQCAALPHLRVRGLMTIGALSADPEPVRRSFRRLRALRDELADAGIAGVTMDWLSMGMSGDFELAVAEGANLLRLGSALFGPRPG